MYTIYVKFDCVDGKRADFIARVKAEGILAAIEAEDGYVKYDYYLSDRDENELLLVEQWASKAHQQAHIAQPHMATLRSFKSEYIANTELREIDIKD